MQTDALKAKSAQLYRDLLTQLSAIHIDHLERKWITISILIITLLVGIITIDALFHGINPPSKVETIDSASLHLSKEFAEENLGVQTDDNGAPRKTLHHGIIFPSPISVSKHPQP
jgi:cytochrome c oxidase subunit 2